MRRFAWLAALALMSAIGGSAHAQTAPAPPPTAAPAADKIYVLETIQTGDMPAAMQLRFTPLHTMAEVEALLKQNRIPFSWRITESPASALPPGSARQLDLLPPNDIFIAKQKVGLYIGAVLETR